MAAIDQGLELKKDKKDGLGQYTNVNGHDGAGGDNDEGCSKCCFKRCNCCECCNCCKCCHNLLRWHWLVIVVVILLVCLGIGLGAGLRMKGYTKGASVSQTTPSPVTTMSPTPYPGVTLQGSMSLTDNYTSAMEEPASAAYITFERNLEDTMAAFYQLTVYSDYYDEMIIIDFAPSGQQVVVSFDVRLTQLDNDDQPGDAHTVLEAQLRSSQLGQFQVTTYRLTVTEPN